MFMAKLMMRYNDAWLVLRSPEGAGGGAAAEAAGGAGAGGNAQGADGGGAPGNDGAAQAANAAAAAGANGAAAADPNANKPWYEQRQWADPALQQHLIKSGYHAGTAEEALDKALKGEISAVSRLGKPPGSLLDAPKEGQSATDWIKANGKAFGLPETIDKYDLKLPEKLPAGTPIDEALMGDYRKFAFEAGMPPAVAQANIDAYAAMMAPRFEKMATDAANADAKLTTTLQGEWGQNYKTKQEQAVRAFQAIAAEMKLDPDQTKLLASKLNDGMGDATLLKFFDVVAGKMGEDTLAIPRGGNAPAMQLADAQQAKERIMAPHTGDMAKAVRDNNTSLIKKLQDDLKGFNTIIAQHS